LPDENHNGAHWTLTIYPDGRTVLSTPNDIDLQQFERVREIYQEWVHNDGSAPLIIGNCVVQFISVGLKREGSEVRSPGDA
jgi:hypothetical protein